MTSQHSNGVGPKWFPPFIRRDLTRLSLFFFSEASWDKHDEGYALKKYPRKECDISFLQAMLRDASSQNIVWKMFGCTILAWVFYLFVRLFGGTSYNTK